MGWFDEQIRLRMQSDDEMMEDALSDMAGSVLGAKASAALRDDWYHTKSALDEILKYYHEKPSELPAQEAALEEQMEYLFRPCGIMRRRVKLDGEWYKDAFGAMLAVRKSDGCPAALIPDKTGSYSYPAEDGQRRVRLNRKTIGAFKEAYSRDAWCFYRPLPMKELGITDLLRYMIQTVSAFDLGMFFAVSVGLALIGMLSVKLNHIVFSKVMDSAGMGLFWSAAFFMSCVTLSLLLAGAAKSMLMQRISIKMGMQVQAAVMMRVLSLPADFFKRYSAGELSSRAENISALCSGLSSLVISTGITAALSLTYITQIFEYTPSLVMPALCVIFVTVLFSAISACMQIQVSEKQMEHQAKESGMSYALISGIQKLKLSGAQKRAFARWGLLHAKGARLAYSPPLLIKANGVFLSAISFTGMLVLYYSAITGRVSVADYYAFQTAYGMVSGAFFSMASIVLSVAGMRPVLKMAEPLLKTAPEASQGRQMVTRLSGGIELSHVSFRYHEHMPLVLDDLSLKIRTGQYVAITGATGCGKTTLLRLLLGFETPQKGAVYYDGRDLSGLDVKSLRSRIGVVMQDGKLFSGDIFSNITICAPNLTMEEAWEAAELAGIARDIRDMPMGMHTFISEGQGGISGGQRQRLLIARAIAPKPKILLFDEATSALDNLTQKRVSESLDGLKCTRVVIAHRLSTIRQCDRIVVLDGGRIVEDGSYEELMGRGGVFAGLVERQKV